MSSSNCVKLVILGESAVGKSSIVLRFVRDEFYEFQESTIGAAYQAQTVTVPGTGEVIKFELWDTAGQERYRSLAPMYYRGAPAAVVVYDITSEESFTRGKQWVKELQLRGDPNVIIALAGNKADLSERRAIEYSEAKAYADDNDLLFMETSARANQNIRELFVAIASKLPGKGAGAGQAPQGAGGAIRLGEPGSPKKEAGKGEEEVLLMTTRRKRTGSPTPFDKGIPSPHPNPPNSTAPPPAGFAISTPKKNIP